MALKTGTWVTNIDGLVGSLVIDSVDPAGIVSGSLGGAGPALPFSGLWDETAKHLSFLAANPVLGPGSLPEYYDAYLITTPRDAQPGNDLQFTLVGTVQSVGQDSLQLRRTNARRSRFGWFSTISEVA